MKGYEMSIVPYKLLDDSTFNKRIVGEFEKAQAKQKMSQIAFELKWVVDHIKKRLYQIEDFGISGENLSWFGPGSVKVRLFYYTHSQASFIVYYNVDKDLFFHNYIDVGASAKERFYQKYLDYKEKIQQDFFSDELREHILGGIDDELLSNLRAKLDLSQWDDAIEMKRITYGN